MRRFGIMRVYAFITLCVCRVVASSHKAIAWTSADLLSVRHSDMECQRGQNPIIMDLHNSIMEIHYSIIGIHNSIMEIHNSIMEIHN